MSPKAAILAILCAGSLIAEQAPAKVDFGRDIQPLLREHCVECHGASQQMRGLRLDRRRDALPNRVGANGARIVPGDSARSVLFQRLTGTQVGPQMPPAGFCRAKFLAPRQIPSNVPPIGSDTRSTPAHKPPAIA